MHVIALAGLPGTGKSALARELSSKLGCAVLDKDAIRVELFADEVDYSAEQNARAMAALYGRVAQLAREGATHVIVDGRTFTRRAHVEELRDVVRHRGASLTLIECICDAAVARERLEHDHRRGSHPARNRTAALHGELERVAEPIDRPDLVVDTTRATPAEIAERLVLHMKSDNHREHSGPASAE